MQFGKIFTSALVGWLKDAKAMKYLAILFVLQMAMIIATILVLTPILGKFIPVLSNTSMMDPSQFTATIIPAIFGAIWVMVLVGLVFWIVISYVSVLLQRHALSMQNLPMQTFGIGEFIRLILLGILGGFCALVSWYNKKFALILIAIILLFILAFVTGPIGALLAIIVFPLSLIYMFVIIYNGLRLSQASSVFLTTDKGIKRSLRHSWGITKGLVWQILFVNFVVAILGQLIIVIGDAIMQVFMPYFFPNLAKLQAMSQLGGSALSEVQDISSRFSTALREMLNPVGWVVLSIPRALTMSFYFAILMFGSAALYSEILSDRAVKMPASQQVPKPQSSRPTTALKRPVARKPAKGKK